MNGYLKKLIQGVFCLFLSAYFTVSCSNELEVNADWKEIGIAYCLLDKRDSVQYVKLNKAYLNNETNALDLAQVEDSIFFDDNDIIVEIGVNNNYTQLERIRINDKDDGIFASPGAYIYKTPSGFEIIDSRIYKLRIRNTRTGYEMLSSTSILKDGVILDPFSNSNQINFARCNNDETITYITRSMKIQSGREAKFYDLDIIFHYKEVNTKTLDTTDKTVDWSRGRLLKTSSTLGGQEISATYSGEDFYKLLAEKIEKPSDGIERIIGKVDFQYSSGGQEIYDYINVNRPSIGIVQKKPEYTNIENGLGIFSSRTVQVLPLDLDKCSKEQIIQGAYTFDLGFVR